VSVGIGVQPFRSSVNEPQNLSHCSTDYGMVNPLFPTEKVLVALPFKTEGSPST